MNISIGECLFFSGLIIFLIIRVSHEWKTLKNNIQKSHKKSLEKLLLTFLVVSQCILPVIYIFSDWLAFADYSLPSIFVIVGLPVLSMSLWLFWRSHSDLGKNWSKTLEIREDHTLIQTGIYRTIRHPMYSSLWLYAIAQALMLSNWIAGPSMLLSFGLLYFIRVQKEEEMMLSEFGGQYETYIGTTGRLFPKL